MILFTSACVSNSNNPNDNIDKVYIKTEDYLNRPIKVINFNYNGHQYIMFTPYTALRDNTVVHDPDCPCNKNNSM